MGALLVVQHQDDCPAGRFGPWLEAAGASLDVRRPDRGDPLPEDLAGHDGLLVLGGSAGAYDDATAPWLPAVRALVRGAAATGVPTLGICLGHQLAAVALGGQVRRNPRGQTVGLTPVTWTDEAPEDALFGPFAARRTEPRAIHWNNDVVTELPDGAVLLATGPGGEVQAARLAPGVWGVQLHPEADARLAGLWADSEDEGHPTREPDSPVLASIAAAHDELDATWEPLATAFGALVAGRTAAGAAAGS